MVASNMFRHIRTAIMITTYLAYQSSNRIANAGGYGAEIGTITPDICQSS